MSLGKVHLATARRIGDHLVQELEEACHRVEVKGSVARGGQEWVGDVEIVALPRTVLRDRGLVQADLFAKPEPQEEVSAVWEVLDGMVQAGRVIPITPGRFLDDQAAQRLPPAEFQKLVRVHPFKFAPRDARWAKKRTPGSRYLKLWLVRPQVQVDLFLPVPEAWGSVATIRTGPKEFSARLAFVWKSSGRRCPKCRNAIETPHHVQGCRRLAGGMLVDEPRRIPTPEEEDFFREIGVQWVDPPDRHEAGDVVPATERGGGNG